MTPARLQVTIHKRNLAFRDGKECWFCGESMEKDKLTVEHLLAVVDGGNNHINNLVLACPPCNIAVGTMPIAYKVRFREKKRSEIEVRIT